MPVFVSCLTLQGPKISIVLQTIHILFRVVLGQPLGGAFLTGDSECAVNIENDVPYAHISFQDEVCEVKQSDKVLTLPVTRSKRTEGIKNFQLRSCFLCRVFECKN